MSLLRQSRLRRALAAKTRPRPPEGLLARIRADIPEDLFPSTAEELASPSPDESPPRRLLWTVAASLLVVVLAGVMTVRLREAASPSPEAAAQSSPARALDVAQETQPAAEEEAQAVQEVQPAREARRESPPSASTPPVPPATPEQAGPPGDERRMRFTVAEPSAEKEEAKRAIAAQRPAVQPRAEVASRPPSRGQADTASIASTAAAPAEVTQAGPEVLEERAFEDRTAQTAAAAPANPVLELDPLVWRDGVLRVAGRTLPGLEVELRRLLPVAELRRAGEEEPPVRGVASDRGTFELEIEGLRAGDVVEVRVGDGERLTRTVPRP